MAISKSSRWARQFQDGPLAGASSRRSKRLTFRLRRRRLPFRAYGAVAVVAALVLVSIPAQRIEQASAATGCPTGSVTHPWGHCQKTFTANETWTVPAGLTTVDVVVVGGGGAGGPALYDNTTGARRFLAGNGGGGGQVIETIGVSVTGTVTVVIGTGGDPTGGTATARNGASSTFGTITAAGGGGGQDLPASAAAGFTGMYGGSSTGSTIGTTSSGTTSYSTVGPFAGGQGYGISGAGGGNPYIMIFGGGAAGAGAAGASASGSGPGGGGIGAKPNGGLFRNANVYYGGGGAGSVPASGAWSPQAGGNGGGAGSAYGGGPGNGTANTGGGASGGSPNDGVPISAGTGGSGVVIVKFPFVTLPPTVTSASPASGSNAGGTTITITGANFDSGATVTVGGATCTSPTRVSATSMTCVTPAGTLGAVDIVVTNPDTTSGTGVGVYTYIVPSAPGTPGTPTAVAGNAQATVTISAGSGGAATTYTVTAVQDNTKTCTVTAPATSCTVSGLTNGTSYTFTSTATNVMGTSSVSAASSAVIPGPPGVPGTPTVAVGNAQATVTIAQGSGGTPVTYTVTAGPGGATCTVTSPATSCVVTGLTNGTAYTFTSTATNSIGTSSASAASSSVVPGPPGVPATPTGVAGDTQVTVSVTAGSGGTPVTYTVTTVEDNTKTCTVTAPATSCVVTGLTNGTPYTFTATATNGSGSSAASAVSTAVTPAAGSGGGGAGGGGSSGGGSSSGGSSTDSGSSGAGSSSTGSTTSTTTGADSAAAGGAGSGSGTRTPSAMSTPATPVLDPVSNPADTRVPAGGVPAGAGEVRVGGRKVEVTVAPNRRNNPDGLVVSGGDFTMRIAGLNSAGQGLPLSDDGALILQQRNLARTEGTGFQANGPVQVYIMSTPRFLGTVMANADGTFTGTVLLPADIKPGRHTLQSNGFTPDGKVRSVSVGVLLRAAKAAKPSNAGATVYFAPLSSELSTEGKSTLNTLVKKVGAKTMATVVVGYVQGTSFTDNDTELSTERARVVARYLREQGIKGRTVRGEGVAPEAGAKARRVQVNITYRS